MSIIFRRIRGRIIPIRTDGARQKKTIGDKVAKAGAIGTVAGGTGYVAFRKAHAGAIYGSEKALTVFDKIQRLSNRFYRKAEPYTLWDHSKRTKTEFKLGGNEPDLSATKPRMTKNGVPDKRFKAKPQPHFKVVVKPVSPEDMVKWAKSTRRAEQVGLNVTRVSNVMNKGKRVAMFASAHAGKFAAAIGVGVAGISLYEQLRRRKK